MPWIILYLMSQNLGIATRTNGNGIGTELFYNNRAGSYYGYQGRKVVTPALLFLLCTQVKHRNMKQYLT